MNDAPRFLERQPPIFRLPSSRFLHEQRHRVETGLYACSITHDVIALFVGIRTKRGKVLESIIVPSFEIVLFLLVLIYGIQACANLDASEYQKGTRTENYATDELLVVFKQGIPESRTTEINESLHAMVLRKMLCGRVNLVRVPPDQSLQQLRKAYSSFPEVEDVDLNYRIGPSTNQR